MSSPPCITMKNVYFGIGFAIIGIVTMGIFYNEDEATEATNFESFSENVEAEISPSLNNNIDVTQLNNILGYIGTNQTNELPNFLELAQAYELPVTEEYKLPTYVDVTKPQTEISYDNFSKKDIVSNSADSSNTNIISSNTTSERIIDTEDNTSNNSLEYIKVAQTDEMIDYGYISTPQMYEIPKYTNISRSNLAGNYSSLANSHEETYATPIDDNVKIPTIDIIPNFN